LIYDLRSSTGNFPFSSATHFSRIRSHVLNNDWPNLFSRVIRQSIVRNMYAELRRMSIEQFENDKNPYLILKNCLRSNWETEEEEIDLRVAKWVGSTVKKLCIIVTSIVCRYSYATFCYWHIDGADIYLLRVVDSIIA
jgi:hypothetical protein